MQRTLYAMAKVVCDECPEIKDRFACRRALRAVGFGDDVIKQHLSLVQHMARVIRGKTADRLVQKMTEKS